MSKRQLAQADVLRARLAVEMVQAAVALLVGSAGLEGLERQHSVVRWISPLAQIDGHT